MFNVNGTSLFPVLSRYTFLYYRKTFLELHAYKLKTDVLFISFKTMECFTASVTKIFVLLFAFFIYTEMISIHHREKRYTKVSRFLLIHL